MTAIPAQAGIDERLTITAAPRLRVESAMFYTRSHVR